MISERAKAALKAHREKQEGTPRSPVMNPVEKWEDHDTRNHAIRAKCWKCQGGTATKINHIREYIRECDRGRESADPCPLFFWRPYKKIRRNR